MRCCGDHACAKGRGARPVSVWRPHDYFSLAGRHRSIRAILHSCRCRCRSVDDGGKLIARSHVAPRNTGVMPRREPMDSQGELLKHIYNRFANADLYGVRPKPLLGRASSTPRMTCPPTCLDLVAWPICQDGARNEVNEMIGPWREGRLVDRPAERRYQGEQVVPIHIGARRSLALSTQQQLRACCMHCGARSIKSGVRVRVGGRHHGDNALIALGECHQFSKPAEKCFACRTRRFEFGCLLRQCVQIGTQQRFEQGFSRREMTKHRSQPDAGPVGDIAHRHVGTMRRDDVTRDPENLAAIFFCVGSHGLP